LYFALQRSICRLGCSSNVMLSNNISSGFIVKMDDATNEEEFPIV
jgi:hypothetical protein